jgi:hypothetical protein
MENNTCFVLLQVKIYFITHFLLFYLQRKYYYMRMNEVKTGSPSCDGIRLTHTEKF